jgi:RHS repeat-associated protein
MLNVNQPTITKHFYIEGQRIISKLGDGMSDATKGSKAGKGDVSYGAKQEEAREGIVRNLKFLGEDGALLTAGNSGKTPPGQIIGDGPGGGSGGGNKDGEKFQYFYHPDHLGSTSYITDASGEVYQHLEYFAFGETFVEEHSNTDRTPYLFNGKELDEETGLYYYGARYYEPQVSVWLSVDPLLDRYLNLSPYVYVANNPLNFIDPDGKKIKPAKGVSKEFMKALAQAVEHLNKHGAAGIMASLEKSTTIYYIQEGDGVSSYLPSSRTITWDPDMGIITSEGNVMSPTAVLNHEVDHANQHDKNPVQYKKDRETKDVSYTNIEEKRVITGSEQETAQKLGEVKEGEVTRKDHGGSQFYTKGPTSTEGRREIIVTPKEDEND